jgi:signal transduction histidine kinase
MANLIEVVVDEFRSMIARKDVRITYCKPEETMIVPADEERFKQVIRNLLSNAVKFSPASGTIHVRVRRVGKTCLLSVRDEGPGIPPHELEIVFDKFMQSSKTKSGGGGTGLGLAICREIVSGHHGRIWAENNAPQGCIFYCELPLAPAAEDDDFDSGCSPTAAMAVAEIGEIR